MGATQALELNLSKLLSTPRGYIVDEWDPRNEGVGGEEPLSIASPEL